MAEAGIGAAISISSKFIERSKFTSRHDAIYDKELDKSTKLAQRFDSIPCEDVDHFELEQYTKLRSQLLWRSLQDLSHYRDTQEEYKTKEWFRDPVEKFQLRGRVRKAKRRVQSSATKEGRHVDDLDTYSRSSPSRCSSVASFSTLSESSGLDLERSRPYRTDSCSIRATGGSPPYASLEDVSRDERMDSMVDQVTGWLLSVERNDVMVDDNANLPTEPDLSITSFTESNGKNNGNSSSASVPPDPQPLTVSQRNSWGSEPAKYVCQVVHPCKPPGLVLYYSFPFFTLKEGELYEVLQEAGHPNIHPKLPLHVDGGEECLLLCRDGNGVVGWALASFLELYGPVFD